MHAAASLAFVYRRERGHSARQSQCNDTSARSETSVLSLNYGGATRLSRRPREPGAKAPVIFITTNHLWAITGDFLRATHGQMH
jgi:hypothetical protein